MRNPSPMLNTRVFMRDHRRISTAYEAEERALISIAREHVGTLMMAAVVLLTVVNVMAVTPPV